MGSLLVVNLRGTVNIPAPMRTTLQQLHLETRFRATILPDNEVSRGMVRKVKEYVAWHTANPAIVGKLLQARGMRSNRVRLSEELVKGMGFANLKSLAEGISGGTIALSKIDGLKPSFALSPPKGGFRRSTRRMYSQGGVLGENPQLPSIVETMI